MPQRSINFTKTIFRQALKSPITWIIFFSFVIQVYQSEQATIFGADYKYSFDFMEFGFSPEQPMRFYMLPWLFSFLVHKNWEHFTQNIGFICIIYFFLRGKVATNHWWRLMILFQLTINAFLLIESFFNSEVRSLNLYVGLSGIAYSLLGYSVFVRTSHLRIIAIVAGAIELFQLTKSDGEMNTHILHLTSLVIGFFSGWYFRHSTNAVSNGSDFHQGQ